jgi:mono/diheme cytochrome c family protein
MVRIWIVAMLAAVAIYGCGQQSASVQAQQKTVADPVAGRELFQQNCGSCHTVKMDLVGPALAGVTERWPDKEKLYRFIKNAPAVIQEDQYAKELWEKYNRTAMTPFPNLTDADIDAMMAYIEKQSK